MNINIETKYKPNDYVFVHDYNFLKINKMKVYAITVRAVEEKMFVFYDLEGNEVNGK